jgi:hypothetical protein
MTDTMNALSRLKDSFKYYSEHAGASVDVTKFSKWRCSLRRRLSPSQH